MTNDLPANPFDFSTPASTDLFAGRSKELGDVDRFVSTVASGKPSHLLIHGRRGVGKTSLLGQVRDRLTTRGAIHGSVVLDASSTGDVGFFSNVVAALASSVLDAGGLGGRGGQFDQDLEKALLGYEVSPGAGPIRCVQFAARQPATGSSIPDRLIAEDLAELVDAGRDVDSPSLVLVVDEADRLTASATTIQRFRNLIITPGLVSTILCGTDDLLAAVDSALSPVGRHFERVRLDVLADPAETRECLARPIRSAGLNDLSLIPNELPGEIHRITRGRPYEVILLGHAMYRRLTGRNRPLKLSDEVLDDVQGQLRPTPDEEAALGTIRRLEGPQLLRAAKYCVDPRLSTTDFALIHAAFDTEPTAATLKVEVARIEEEWAELEEMGLATASPGALRPRFGELAQLYLKYKAIRAGQTEPIEGPYSYRLSEKVKEAVVAAAEVGPISVYQRSGFALENGTDASAAQAIISLGRGDWDTPSLLELPLSIGSLPPEVAHVEMVLVPFEINEDGFAVLMTLPLVDQDVTSTVASVEALAARMAPFGVQIGNVSSVRLSRDDWSQWVFTTIFALSSTILAQIWFSGSRDRALTQGREILEGLAERILGADRLPEPGLLLLNNVGFIHLAAGLLVEALEMFERSAVRGGLAIERDASKRGVLLCNLAAAAAGVGRYPEARSWASQALELSVSQALDRPGVLVVFGANPTWAARPTTVDKPDVGHIARATLVAIQAVTEGAVAVDASRELADAVNAPWGYRHLADVAERCRRLDLAEEARRMAASAPIDEGPDIG